MTTLLDRLARAAGFPRPALTTKAAGPGFALYAECRPSWTSRDPASLARVGYQRNPVVYRAVRIVAESAASLPLAPVSGDGRDLMALLARPNPRESGTQLLETIYADLMLSGSAALWSKCTKDCGCD